MVFPHLVGEMSGVVSYGIWGPRGFVIRELCCEKKKVKKQPHQMGTCPETDTNFICT